MPQPDIAADWNRECVICGHKWQDGPQEDSDCPACCQRRRAGKNTPPTPIREAVFGAIDSATDKTNDPRTIDVDAFFEALAEGGYEVVKTTAPPRAYMAGWSVEKLLDKLPMMTGMMLGSERMKGASDAELDAWVHGIAGATENVRQIIADWRKVNGG